MSTCAWFDSHMNTTTAARKTALLARTTTATLIQSALTLEAVASKTAQQRMTAAWIYDEIENRVGLITADEDQEFCRVYDETDSYMAALVSLRPQLANA